MTDLEQREAARKFINKWRGYEKGETHRFWIYEVKKIDTDFFVDEL